MRRRLSFLLRRLSPIRAADADRPLAVYDPVAIENRLNRYMKRRLSDELEAVIHAAYLSGDLETAEELLVILQNKRERDARKYDRRISDVLAERLTSELVAPEESVLPLSRHDSERVITGK